MAKSTPAAEIESVETAPYTTADQAVAALAAGTIAFGDLYEFSDVVIESGDLWKGEQLDNLIGVPFVILGGTYRNDKMREFQGVKMRGDYVTLDIMLGDEAELRKAGLSQFDCEDRGIEPLQRVLFNDGSTGVRRQLTRYLHMREYIVLSDKPADEIVTGGGLGVSDFDMPVQMWKDMRIGEVNFDGGDTVTWGFTLPRLLVAKRGFRVSEYTTDAYGDGKTRYLA